MYAADDEIEFLERVLAEVHLSVPQDVALQPGEDSDARVPFLVVSLHLARECNRTALVQTVRHGQRLGVVRDGDVLVAENPRGFRHLLQSPASVGFRVCMCRSPRMSPDSIRAGSAPFCRGLDLALVFPQFGRDPG